MDPHGWPGVLLEGVVGGVLGSFVGAAVGYWIALQVVKRTRDADRQTARELAGYEAARRLIEAVWDTVAAMRDVKGEFRQSEPVKAREDALAGWYRAETVEGAALHDYVPQEVLSLFGRAAQKLEGVIYDAVTSHRRDSHRGDIWTAPEMQEVRDREAIALQELIEEAKHCATVLDAFLRFGPEWRDLAPTTQHTPDVGTTWTRRAETPPTEGG